MNIPKENKIETISAIFEKDLYLNVKDEDVRRLQKLLNRDIATQVAKEGPGSLGSETNYYGQATRDAVIRFQLKYGVIKNINDSGAVRVGAQTRAKLKQVFDTAVVTTLSIGTPSFIWPLEKSYKRITTPFSEPWIINPKKNHTGIDIAAPVGAKVFTAADGIVEKIGYLDADKKWAQYVDVRHDLENYCTAYLHINPIIKIGDRLNAGDVVGYIAKLIGTGTHLHFNVWKGAYNNPISHRGALPSQENVGNVEPKSDPAFPSNFVNPMSLTYS